MTSCRTMMELKCVVFWGIMTFFWTLSRGDTEVSCVFSEICILPCSFQADKEPVVHWTQLAADSQVHSYYDSKDQVEHQNQTFRGRTSLFGDQVSSGNASLRLAGVEIQDEGRFLCNTSTTGGTKLSFINVTVDAPVKTVNLRQAGNRITCSSDGIYPEPDVTWSTIPPSKGLLRSTTIVQLTEQQLYNIRSSVMVPDNDTGLTYSCTVSTRRNNDTARLVKRETTDRGQGMGLVALVILVTVSMILVPYVVEKCNKSRKCKQLHLNNVSVAEAQPENEPISCQGNRKETPVCAETQCLHPQEKQISVNSA